MRFLKFSLLFLSMPTLVFAQLSISQSVSTGSSSGTAFVAPATSASVAAPVSATAVPKIYCAYPHFDFHNVDEGGDIVHMFHIVNRGKAVLKISNVSTSCGCTAAVEDKKEIPPGGRGIIKATYHTKGRPGHATKVITVSSNDPANPNFQLKLDMTVVREIDVQPEKVYLYNIQHGQVQTTTVRILGKPKKVLKVLSAQSTNGAVTVSAITPYKEEATHRYGATLQIDVPADHVLGDFTDTIKVQTNSKKKPEVDIDVWGEVVGKFTYSPHSVYFAPHQNNPITVAFTAQDTQHFTIRKVESQHRLARPEVKKVSFGNGVEQYQVLIYPPKNVPANSDGKDTISVTTNDLEQPLVTIDVQASK